MKKLIAMLLTLALLLSLTACGGSSGSTALKTENAAEAPMAYDMAAGAVENQALVTESGALDTIPADSSRKWIVTMYLTAETEDLDSLLDNLNTSIGELDGYVENHSVYNGSAYNASRRRSASLTIRIPAEQAEDFTQHLGDYSNIVRQEQEKQDITLTYVATESRMKALQTEEARLLELLSQAENMSDLLEIEARLTDVRYELESVTSQMRTYDNQVNYATIYLDISEVVEYTPVEEPTLWERISGGFADSIEGVREGAVDLLVWVLANSPYLVVWGVLAFLGWTVGRRFKGKLSFKRRKKNQE